MEIKSPQRQRGILLVLSLYVCTLAYETCAFIKREQQFISFIGVFCTVGFYLRREN